MKDFSFCDSEHFEIWKVSHRITNVQSKVSCIYKTMILPIIPSSLLFRIFHELSLPHALLQFPIIFHVLQCVVEAVWSRGWRGIVFVGVEVTVQSKERVSIKGCCASLRDSDSHIPRCRVSALYSRPPILSVSSFPNSAMLSVLLARHFNLFSLSLLFFHGHFQRSDWFRRAKNLHGLFGTLYRRFALVVRVIIMVHWRFKKRDKRNV